MSRRRSTRLSPSRPPPARPLIPNQLLASLPPADYNRLAERLETVPLKVPHFIHRPGDPIEHVYFPGGGFFSELAVLASGDMVEVATIGREGMAGALGIVDGPVPSATMVQADIERCYRLSVRDFRRELKQGGPFFRLILRYSRALMGVVMQSTACNAVHPLERRLARWLLLAHDRVMRDEFPLTQEFLAMMLGAARPTVSVVAGILQKTGSITYHRGHVHIRDRSALEAASCECYSATTRLLQEVTSGELAARALEAEVQ